LTLGISKIFFEKMSDILKHECGIVLIRLLKPLDFYRQKYGSARYALNKLNLLMEKQHNRGQDGAGVACIKFDMPPGERYIGRFRSNDSQPLREIVEKINSYFEDIAQKNPDKINDTDYLKEHVPFVGELLMGHLRYGTFGKNSIESCHPFLRQNNWKSRNLVVAGNFNLTNVDEQFQQLLELGQHPKEMADTVTVLEKIGHFLDMENERLFQEYKSLGYSNREISDLIAKNIDIADILRQASKRFDGGYVVTGMVGHGDAFVMRDPNGIRPCFYYADDEIIAVTSERPVLQTAFNIPLESVKELAPGHSLIIKRNGDILFEEIRSPEPRTSCSFERIYFSRGSDADIYQERKALGRNLAKSVLKSLDYDIENAVFSFVPNTAETAFYGMVEGVNNWLNDEKRKRILALNGELSDSRLQDILALKVRTEKLAIKDAKLRTFIADDLHRDEMVAHVYDVTYGIVRKHEDTLVITDDSIVRGTTLKQSILRILDRLQPKKIIIVSSAPQIRYPDCYGIDMAKMGDFIAFQAAIELHKEHGTQFIVDQVFDECIAQDNKPKEEIVNFVKRIYEPFSAIEISAKIAELVTPSDIHAKVEVIFQSLEDLHEACPGHSGDWYFSGNYPTPGGNKVVNRAFINYYKGVNERAY
jgi:amidophosphoribosyltransferase